MSAVQRGTSGGAIGITFTAIGTATLLVRLYTRYFLVKNAGAEELAIVFAWVRIMPSKVPADLDDGDGGDDDTKGKRNGTTEMMAARHRRQSC
jgi:hypothetical protein